MIIIGLHFGHDASVTVLRDGQVAGHYLRERADRVKHALGLSYDHVSWALDQAGISEDDIDYCAVTTTQNVEYVFFDPDRLSIEVDDHPPEEFQNPRLSTALKDGVDLERMNPFGIFRKLLREREADHPYYRRASDLAARVEDPDTLPYLPPVENFGSPDAWNQPLGLEDLRKTEFSPEIVDRPPLQFHLPVKVTIGGRKIPGCAFSHHYAHAAYAYFENAIPRAAIITQDAGMPSWPVYVAGMYYYGDGNRIVPLFQHSLGLGAFYDQVAGRVGFSGIEGGSGKLMGLSSYGRPKFFSRAMAGNLFDAGMSNDGEVNGPFHAYVRQHAASMGYDLDDLGDEGALPTAIASDMAASAQAIVEESLLHAADVVFDVLMKGGLPTTQLALSGGVALNCPANSRLFNESKFDGVHVPPAVGDEGLSIGACYLVHHHLLGHPFDGNSQSNAEKIFRGAVYGEADFDRAFAPFAERMVIEPGDGAEAAARTLTENGIVCWYEGRSEAGPRALGHRSIVADPTRRENWDRVNKVKGRHPWRPLAPSVLRESVSDWFFGTPADSPFMNFNAHVRSKRLPAITHVDGTARIQTVEAEVGGYYRMIHAFAGDSGVPVVLNTSFNGPGEPIAESPADALGFFDRSTVDMLVIDNRIIKRR